MVYPFSCQNYELRNWLAGANVNPERDVRLAVIPPPLIAESLKAKHIQGFCVGEPWNSLSVEQGNGHIVTTKNELWSYAPEKVLGVRKAWASHHPDKLTALLKALYHAAQWLDIRENRVKAAQILSQEQYLNVSEQLILRSLTGQLVIDKTGQVKHDPDFLVFHEKHANFPCYAHAIWIMAQMKKWQQLENNIDTLDIAKEVYRPDLYRAALKGHDFTGK